MQVTDEMVEAAAQSDAEFDKRGWLAMPRTERERYLARSNKALTTALAWRPIETAPRGTLRGSSETLILGHSEKKWIRFGRWYAQVRCWYYSGTNERSQYAQVRGDDPTHWMPLPEPPATKEGGER